MNLDERMFRMQQLGVISYEAKSNLEVKGQYLAWPFVSQPYVPDHTKTDNK